MAELTEAKKWYSIKEAAAYLDVGEPTLYRWMREGSITFRKVGDSTRFWQEDLDAVMEVHPGKVDPKKVQRTCPVCHHEKLTAGEVHSTGKTYFRPEQTKFWVLKDANIDLKAYMCERCGNVAWFGDVEKLKSLKPNSSGLKTSKGRKTKILEGKN